MSLIKIFRTSDNSIKQFSVENLSTQLSTGSHAIITITIDIGKYPSYYKFFIEEYDRPITGYKLDNVFQIQHKNYLASGCLIKSLDIDNMNYLMHVNIISDYFQEIPISELRDQVINDILDQNFDKD
jgi:hypothetical protein